MAEQAAEAANLAQHSLGEGFMGEILDALLGAVGAIDVYARIGVGDTGGLRGFLGQANLSVVSKSAGSRRSDYNTEA